MKAQSPRVLLLGDSVVEGWWLSRESSLASLLTSKKGYFINAGLRSTGPLFTAPRLPALIKAYEPQKILYLVNENDVLDDHLACALAENRAAPPSSWKFTTADFSLPAWTTWPPALVANWAPARTLRQVAYRRRWRELVLSQEAHTCEPCAGLKEIQRLAKNAGIDLRVAQLEYQQYLGGGPYFRHPTASAQLGNCLRQLGIHAAIVKIEWADEAERERLFWPGDSHPSPAGMAHLASLLQRMLEKGGALE